MRRSAGLVVILAGFFLLTLVPRVSAAPQSQVDATAFPTVTGTPAGPVITVPDQVNVRSGPGIEYDLVGVLIAGQQAPAVGRSPAGEWVQIVYPGVDGNVAWVYAAFVLLDTGTDLLPLVEPVPTPTPRITATIDPTLAAQFNLSDELVTRQPTFTPAQPVILPTFEAVSSGGASGFPPILAILGLFLLGIFGTVISTLRGN
jgi:hypothetical protein